MNSAVSGRRVLVVEDEQIVFWVLEDMLTDMGCEVVGPAARASEALAMIESAAFDLAILDVNLNGQKSFPVADALGARGMPFMFSTGYSQDGIPEAYRVHPILQKPFSQTELGALLERVMTEGSLAP